jgi:tRNA(Arg) A34 adenosine deaminase TadA
VRYPLNAVTDPTADGGLGGGTYLGHNIAALAVDVDGYVIDFDFNHNEVFNSSVEHAESRLLRRLFSLTQLQDSWKTAPPPSAAPPTSVRKGYYGNLLSGVTLYTTLESCAQCSGIMALAKLARVVFLQTDPGQYAVGNIMRNMTVGTGLPAPYPLPARSVGLRAHDELDAAYERFRRRGAGAPMVTLPDGTLTTDSATTSITSFLCTREAHDIFAAGRRALDELTLTTPGHRPDGAADSVLTNEAVLAEARSFVVYAIEQGARGTPHRA